MRLFKHGCLSQPTGLLAAFSMTREELCDLLGLPADTPAAEVVRARARRFSEIALSLREEDLPKPVKLKLQQETALLESANDLVAQLEIIGRAETYFAEIAAEIAKPNAVRGVIRLCLSRIKPLVPEIKDEAVRFGFEKRIIEIEERLGPERKPSAAVPSMPPFASIPSPPPPPASAPPAAAPTAPPPSELRAAGPTSPAAPKPVPKPSALSPTRGTLLQLVPVRIEGTLRQPAPPIHLVARPRFVLGRRRASVDFATVFLPENEANRQKNETISRVNTTFFLKGNQIWVQDGEVLAEGKVKPSTNGTIIDGQSITAAIALNFAKERRLKLGQFGYELAVLQLPAVSPDGPLAVPAAITISTQPTQMVPQRPLGCLRFLPVTCREVVVTAVWLLSEATLGSAPQCAVRLEQPGLPPVAVRFHHWQDGFWLEVPAGGASAVALDEHRLAAGEVLPLQPAHVIRLGNLNYELRIS